MRSGDGNGAAPAGFSGGDIASGEHQVALDAAHVRLRPALTGLDHDVDVAQGRRRVVEASERDLRLRGEAEVERLAVKGAAAV